MIFAIWYLLLLNENVSGIQEQALLQIRNLERFRIYSFPL